MADKQRISPRQIVGFSLPPERAEEIKAEAKRRGISLRALMDELWDLYRQKQSKS